MLLKRFLASRQYHVSSFAAWVESSTALPPTDADAPSDGWLNGKTKCMAPKGGGPWPISEIALRIAWATSGWQAPHAASLPSSSESPGGAFEAGVRRHTGMQLIYAPHRVRGQLAQLQQYLDGRRRRFSGKIDWSVVPAAFSRAALEAVLAIPYGHTRTYAQIARIIGHPGAARAVGRANATNPMPLVIPCHRVIGTDGSLRGYGGAGGLKTKAWLLKMESTHVPRT